LAVRERVKGMNTQRLSKDYPDDNLAGTKKAQNKGSLNRISQ